MAKRDITSFFSLPFPNKRLKIENKEPLDSNNENSKLIRKEVSNSTFLKWKKEHPWLIQEENLMLCTLCKEYAKPEETNFVNGCPALRYETDSSYSMKKEMQEIIPGLYLGPFSSATKSRLKRLEEAGITHIVCVRHELEASYILPNFPEKFVYSVINLADASTTNIIPLLPQVKQFIDNCFRTGGKVLVHGNAGVSRSAALVIGYIMETKKMPYRDAFTLVQVKRHCICPNEGFMHQLKEYEPIYKAKVNFYGNGHTSKVTGKLKRKIDQTEEKEPVNNSMDVCEDSQL